MLQEMHNKAIQNIKDEGLEGLLKNLDSTDSEIIGLEDELDTLYRRHQEDANNLLKQLDIRIGRLYVDRSETKWAVTNITHNKDNTHVYVTKVKKDGTLYNQHIHQSKFDMMTFIALKNAVEWVDN